MVPVRDSLELALRSDAPSVENIREGVETTAAFGVAMQLWTYLQMPAMALGAAVSAMACASPL